MPRGAKPGERRGGRQKGSRNKLLKTLNITVEGKTITEIAREYTKEAIEALVKICLSGESEAAIISAANSLLDRGHGKALQRSEGENTVNINISNTTDALRAALAHYATAKDTDEGSRTVN